LIKVEIKETVKPIVAIYSHSCTKVTKIRQNIKTVWVFSSIN